MSIIDILFLINVIYFSIILVIEIFFADMNLYTTGVTLIFLLIIIVFILYIKFLRKKRTKYLADYKPLIEKGGSNTNEIKITTLNNRAPRDYHSESVKKKKWLSSTSSSSFSSSSTSSCSDDLKNN